MQKFEVLFKFAFTGQYVNENIDLSVLGEKEIFIASLELGRRVSSNPIRIRDSTEIYFLKKNLGRKIYFCPRENQG